MFLCTKKVCEIEEFGRERKWGWIFRQSVQFMQKLFKKKNIALHNPTAQNVLFSCPTRTPDFSSFFFPAQHWNASPRLSQRCIAHLQKKKVTRGADRIWGPPCLLVPRFLALQWSRTPRGPPIGKRIVGLQVLLNNLKLFWGLQPNNSCYLI